jgi:predicted helicase
MSVSGISSSSLFDLLGTESAQSQKQQLQQEIQQLGKDLSAGNLSATQADFATLQKDAPQATAAASSASNNPIAQAFQKLAQDLQSGNLSAARQDFSTIQQDVQAQRGGGHHHHSHGQDSSSAQQNPIAQLFSELGQALQSGNLTAAQQAYTTLQQDFQSAGAKGSTSNASPAAGSVQTVA